MRIKLTFVADEIYAELKKDILNHKFKREEKISVEYVMRRFNVCRPFAMDALENLVETGLLSFDYKILTTDYADFRLISRLKMTFYNLNYAVQKLEEKDVPVCFDCLKQELMKTKLAVREQNFDVLTSGIRNFYGCMIEHTEMPSLEKNTDYLIALLISLEKEDRQAFFNVQARGIIDYLDTLIDSLDKREFEKCHQTLNQFYVHNVNLLFGS
ncbi:GntR family transcriptional regulator [Listeria sp. ILCC792]|uniref:GntR family transcriptional regulator n=1 Tax=Listeria sp. ILCC792 TaxID=1918331 RepID=UPI000B58F063|nr:GntR family transcriptional regulator [Listeria sp. ILCC792]